jgi:hypothetical protein
MKYILILIVIIVVFFLSFYIFPIAYFLLKLLIGMGILTVFILGIWIGTLFKK